MHLIADSGSTKTKWVLISEDGVLTRCKTVGFNPYYLSTKDIRSGLEKELIPQLTNHLTEIKKIWFYGAGCTGGKVNQKISQALSSSFPGVESSISSDLLGAARGLCGDKPGIACILGTGSNSCLYDGTRITEHLPPLGFIFVDEGSGAELGRRLIKAYFRNGLNEKTRGDFEKAFTSDRNIILGKIYNSVTPNRELAGFSRFFHDHVDDPVLNGLAKSTFLDFFRNIVMTYTDHEKLPIHFTGSIAFHFREMLTGIMDSLRMNTGQFTKDPMEGLVRFHLKFLTNQQS